MITEYNADRTRRAVFSDDRTMRYRLTIEITCGAFARPDEETRVCVFIMLNPSTADAFKNDPTVKRCIEFARSWDCDVLDVVNLFALRSSKPSVLYDGARGAFGSCGNFSHRWRDQVGADVVNDDAIADACFGAERIIAAWGNHGVLGGRSDEVAARLEWCSIEALRLVQSSGQPMHPLARGKHRIPNDVEPIVWREAIS